MIKNGNAWIKAAEDELKVFEEACVKEVRVATEVLLEALMARTPVWSGESVRNYVVGFNTLPSGSSKGNIGPKPPAHPTGSMPLGPEDNRGPNEAAALNDMRSVISGMNKLGTVHVTNFIDPKKWDLIDNGSAPTKARARNPGGVSMLAIQTTRNKMRNFK